MIKTYTLDDLYKIYLDTPSGSQHEDTPTFLLKLSEIEKEEKDHICTACNEKDCLGEYVHFEDPSMEELMDRGSYADQMGDYS